MTKQGSVPRSSRCESEWLAPAAQRSLVCGLADACSSFNLLQHSGFTPKQTPNNRDTRKLASTLAPSAVLHPSSPAPYLLLPALMG